MSTWKKLKAILFGAPSLSLRLVIATALLAIVASFHPLSAQDDPTVTELTELMQKMSQGGDPCPYLPRMKALIKQLASENADVYNAMRPMLAELDKPDSSCEERPAAAKKKKSASIESILQPERPRVSLPAGTAYALPPGAALGSPLDANASQQVLQQVNRARTSLGGVNQRPLPSGELTVQASGNFSLTASGGRHFMVRNTGAVAAIESSDGKASLRQDGRITSVRLASISISHGPRGERTVVNRRGDQTLLVNTGNASGYVERGFSRRGHSYLLRTYVSGTQRTTRLYAVSTVSGMPVATYVPQVTYAPAYYDWINGPWDNAKPKSWQWITDQVLRQFSNYFTPDANYVNPVQWLTDFVLTRALRANSSDAPDASTADLAGGEGASADTPVSAELKQAIAEQLRGDVMIEKAAATNQTAPEANDAPSQFDRVYVVSTGIQVNTSLGDMCWLSAGDILRFDQQQDGSATALLNVASSRLADCPVGTAVSLDVAALRDMHNELRAGLDEGLQTLRSKQGGAGWPPVPSDAVAPPPRPAMEDMPPPDEKAAALLATQQQETKEQEQAFVQAAFAN